MPQSFRELMVHASRCTGVTTAALYGPSQQLHLCAIRCAVYVVARDTLGMSYPAIGQRAGRDHSTVINGYRRRERYATRFPDLEPLVQALGSGAIVQCSFPKRVVNPGTGWKHWTQAEMDEVERLMSHGVKLADMAEIIGRGYEGIRYARQSKRLIVTKLNRRRTDLAVHTIGNLQ